jgi:hypothetical protein
VDRHLKADAPPTSETVLATSQPPADRETDRQIGRRIKVEGLVYNIYISLPESPRQPVLIERLIKSRHCDSDAALLRFVADDALNLDAQWPRRFNF